MKYFFFTFFVIALLATAIRADDEADYWADSKVQALDDDSFDSFMAENPDKLVMVEFFAPWCGHCKHLKPEYIEAAGIVANELSDKAVLAAVDSTVSTTIPNKYEIKGFPTIKIFKNGKEVADYQGQRNANGIVSYLKARLLPAVNEVSSQEEVDALKEANDVVVVGYFDDANAQAKDLFYKVADSLREDKPAFAHIVDAAVATTLGLTASPSMKLLKNFDEPEVSFDFFSGTFNEESMIEFVHENSVPLLALIGADNYEMYASRNLPFFWLFVEETDGDEDVKNVIREVAKVHKDKFSFVYLGGEEYTEHASTLGITSFPGLVIFDEDRKYPFEGEYSVDGLNKFIDAYVAGSLTPFYQSEPAPESNDGPVTVVVGSTFKDLVLENDNDVLIEFYAPWCGHCQSLAPIYERLGEVAQASTGLTVAKMDATANDVPSSAFEVQGFPTIYFVKAGDAENPIPYDGSRDFEGFLDFLAEHSSANLKIPVNLEKLEAKLNDVEKLVGTVRKLIQENKDLKAELEARAAPEDAKAEENVEAAASHDEL